MITSPRAPSSAHRLPRSVDLVQRVAIGAALSIALVGLCPRPAAGDLRVDGFELLDQESTFGLTPELGDRFGGALAAGDFDGDGFDDLAVGVPLEDVADIDDGGLVVIFEGTPDGLSTDLVRTLILGPDGSCTNDGARFGAALAAGDFNDDGFDDLAIGAPEDTIPTFGGPTCLVAGSVTVVDGSSDGLVAGEQVFLRHESGMGTGSLGNNERMGEALAVGDFDGDGIDDLAAGAPGDVVGASSAAGSVTVYFGKPSGLSPAGDSQYWHKDLAGMASFGGRGAFEGDEFGASVAAGDLDGNGADDLLVGVPGDETDSGFTDAGSLHILYGEVGTGLVVNDNLRETTSASVDEERTGAAVAISDANGDGLADVVAGRPGASLDEAAPIPRREGKVLTLTSSGMIGNPFSCSADFQQPNQLEGPEPFDRYGQTLAVGDFDADGLDDLVVGVPLESLDDTGTNPVIDGGLVNVLRGTVASAICATHASWQVWTIRSPGILAPAEDDDNFGHAVAVGDFDGSGSDDLAIGIPGRDGAEADTGAVFVLFNDIPAVFRDGFESGNTSAWSSATP